MQIFDQDNFLINPNDRIHQKETSMDWEYEKEMKRGIWKICHEGKSL